MLIPRVLESFVILVLISSSLVTELEMLNVDQLSGLF